MATNHVILISSICEFFENDNRIIKRGENALHSNHIKKMQYDSTLSIIRGEVYASMKDKVYNVEINLDNDKISSATCTCPRGIRCHHISALALFGHYNISITDKECLWNKLTTKEETEVKTADDLYPPSKLFTAVDKKISEKDIEALQQTLSDFGVTVGFSWLVRKNELISRDHFDVEMPFIEDIITSEDFLNSSNKIEFVKQKCLIENDKIQAIAKITTGQSKNEKWFLIRKFRLTASHFNE